MRSPVAAAAPAAGASAPGRDDNPAPDRDDKPAPAAELGPDPEQVGHVYCEVCKQSLRSARGPKHLASVKHATALKRAEARAQCAARP